MDGAMTKAPLAGEKTGPNPTDRAKAGTKRSFLVEASGAPVGLCVAGANKNDFKMFKETLWSIPVKRPEPTAKTPQHLCLHKGYDYEQVRWRAEAFGFVAHSARVARRPSKRKPAKRPTAGRWSVPTPGWTAFAACGSAGPKG